METPFTGKLAVLGATARTGHFLALNGVWELKQGACVWHRTRIGELEFGEGTVIGEIKGLQVGRMGDITSLYCWGEGTTWLADLLDEGTHALSMEMDMMHMKPLTDRTNRVDAGRVAGALLVRGDAFAWAGVKA